MEEDSVDQLGGGWLDIYGNGNTFSPSALGQDHQLPGHITCPGCSAPVLPGYARNHASCICGCSFCARCGALYLSSLEPEQQQPLSWAAQQPQQLAQSGGSSSGGWLATCRCGAVDKAAVAARWGARAVACWPAEPRLQELLLQLLQLHQEQVIPLLSRQLLQRLQADTQLQWEAVQQAMGAIQQQHEEQPQQAAAGLKQGADQTSLEFLPADATPCFVVNRHTDGQQPDAMQLDGEPRSAGAAAAAAALRITSAAAAAATAAPAAQNGSTHVEPEVMQVDGPSAKPLQGWQQQLEQRSPDVGMPGAAAAQLQEAMEQHLLLDLAAQVADAGQQHISAAAQATAAEAAGLLPHQQGAGNPVVTAAAQGSSAGRGGSGSSREQRSTPVTGWLPGLQSAAAAGAGLHVNAQLAGAGVVPAIRQQLGLEDCMAAQPPRQGPEPMTQDCAEQDEQQLAAERPQQQQLQQEAGRRAAWAVLAAKGDKLQLAAAAPCDEEDSQSSRPPTAAGAQAVPHLAALGLLPEAPPVLPDEPVVLLPAPAQDDQAGHARLFW